MSRSAPILLAHSEHRSAARLYLEGSKKNPQPRPTVPGPHISLCRFFPSPSRQRWSGRAKDFFRPSFFGAGGSFPWPMSSHASDLLLVPIKFSPSLRNELIQLPLVPSLAQGGNGEDIFLPGEPGPAITLVLIDPVQHVTDLCPVPAVYAHHQVVFLSPPLHGRF